MGTNVAAVDGVALTEVERALVDHVIRGERLDLARDEPVDEAAMRAWDASRTVRAAVLRDILRGRLAPDPDPHGLQLCGARITGRVDLEDLTSSIAVVLDDCLLEVGVNARDAKLPYLGLAGCRLEHTSEPPLDAERLTTTDLWLARAVLTGDCGGGAVRLLGAHIGGQLDCSDATLRNASGPALMADNLRVDLDVNLNGGFTAIGAGEVGAVRLIGARIGGALDCSGATVRNSIGPAVDAENLQVDQDLFLREGFSATGGGDSPTVDLNAARIGGVLEFAPARLEHDGSADSALRMDLDGLTYSGLPGGIDSSEWLRLLREATLEYAAQPYQQLAAAHRAAGHDGEVRRVLMAQRRDQIDRGALTGRAERAWARLTGLTLGYGYQPWRALLGLVAVLATTVTLALTLGAHGALARTEPPTPAATACSTVEQVGVGLDLGIPLIKTDARERCQMTTSSTGQALTVVGWVLQVLAWAFATLFIAGFTSAIRKT